MEKEKNVKSRKRLLKGTPLYQKILVLSDPFYIVSSNYGSAHTLHSDFDR